MAIQIGEPPSPPVSGKGFALWALGFRPFSLAAGISAVLLLGVWLLRWQGLLAEPGYLVGTAWHAHEMLFGYGAAVVAGFLLTAVRNWTGMDTPSGGPLAVLALLWLAARVLLLWPVVPGWLLALVDLAFLPAVATSLARPLWRGANRVNRVFLPLFAAMTLGNLLMHLDALGIAPGLWRAGSRLMLDLILLLLLFVGGRVMPFFTEKAVFGSKALTRPWVEKAGFTLMGVYLLLDVLLPESLLFGAVALALAAVQMVRLAGWYHPGVWRIPVLWVLYSGYGWLILGLLLTTLSSWGAIPVSVALHALTVGAVGSMTLGMMARVALGHTGRQMITARAVNFAFVLLNLAALCRVFLPWILPQNYQLWVLLSGLVWLLAFAIFLWVYLPILLRPRVDGRAG